MVLKDRTRAERPEVVEVYDDPPRGVWSVVGRRRVFAGYSEGDRHVIASAETLLEALQALADYMGWERPRGPRWTTAIEAFLGEDYPPETIQRLHEAIRSTAHLPEEGL
jgi:hypothetical protein